MQNKVQSITVIAGEWFDKINGNSYFAGKVLVNGEKAFNMPFQYGYGGMFEQVAIEELNKRGIINEKRSSSFRDLGIAYSATLATNQRQRDLKREYGY